uniref:Uncharacterized protein n=1 Tax=Anopheles culicifacies TaxID=139723 RepID=A0A182MMM8_9DIPT
MSRLRLCLYQTPNINNLMKCHSNNRIRLVFNTSASVIPTNGKTGLRWHPEQRGIKKASVQTTRRWDQKITLLGLAGLYRNENVLAHHVDSFGGFAPFRKRMVVDI